MAVAPVRPGAVSIRLDLEAGGVKLEARQLVLV
jgi:hypothetical protein